MSGSWIGFRKLRFFISFAIYIVPRFPFPLHSPQRTAVVLTEYLRWCKSIDGFGVEVPREETDIRQCQKGMPLQKGWRRSGLVAVSPWLGGTISQPPVLPWLCWVPWPKSGAVWFLQASWLLWPSRWSGSRGWANEKGRLWGPALTLLKPRTSVIQTPILLLGLSQTWWFLLKTNGVFGSLPKPVGNLSAVSLVACGKYLGLCVRWYKAIPRSWRPEGRVF